MSGDRGELRERAATWVGRVLGGALVVLLSTGVSWLESRGVGAEAEAASRKAAELELAAGFGLDETAEAVDACLDDLEDLEERTAELEEALRRVGLDAARTGTAVEVLLSLAQRAYGRSNVDRRIDAIEDDPPELPEPPPRPAEKRIRKKPKTFGDYQKKAQSQIQTEGF